MAELDCVTETSGSVDQYETCLSAGLDCAISDLVSLDSQAEVEQGIFLKEGVSYNQHEITGVFCPLCVFLQHFTFKN